jgi:hypothetical protein
VTQAILISVKAAPPVNPASLSDNQEKQSRNCHISSQNTERKGMFSHAGTIS